ncbi:acetyl-CoA C-acyltransferase [Shewanella avicenniae]|uniref:Acetyl-CoA C-acyltransferase n=1 Tax=Shewanella avicenniae TaxID=2814294 RepID=A0ABX7QTW8_9GAMM|nr:acetyl-CoA C-acyltransferase [Shewanella avicenniae]QSX34932.1 acetyl-CoA C-acyltransferase [Shewanella avicenniae]
MKQQLADDIVIVAARRTAMGGFLGTLASVPAPALAAATIKAMLDDTKLAPESIDEVLLGCVLQAGIGQAPARQAALAAGLPVSVGASTINKVCGSGLKTVMQAYDMIKAGSAGIVIAGGMESMSRAPYIMDKARTGQRMGHGKLYDHMFADGLEDAYTGDSMGSFAQQTANEFGISREAMDAWAIQSLNRANRAIAEGEFQQEIVDVVIAGRQGEAIVNTDEQPGRAKPEKIPALKPAFASDGTITAANSSSISDGAASVLLMKRSQAEQLQLPILATIRATASHAQQPALFTTAPIGALNKLFKQLGWTASDVDLYEINEAFAMVTMLAVDQLALDAERVNVNGGACALGHPIGASGTRLLVTLIHALRHRGLSRGIATLCIGGGEAVAVAVEV